MSKPVLVTGASGFMGSHVTRLLVEQGRTVRVFIRKTSNTEAFRDLPVEIHYGDILDPDSLREAMRGCGSVFYNALDARFWLTDTSILFRNNVDGLVNAMDVALELGIERFIFTSSMGTLGVNPDGPVTEDIEFNWKDRASPYILARLEAENRLLAYCRERGLPGVALCVANTYGPRDYGPTPHGGMVAEIARGNAKHGMNAGQPTVDIRDAAQAALQAERLGRAGERYIIANEFISNRDFYALIAAQTGVEPPRLISLKIAYAVAWVVERIYKLLGRRDYLLRTDAVIMSDLFQEMDHSKATRELDWHPRPIEETVRDAVAWFMARDAQDQDGQPKEAS